MLKMENWYENYWAQTWYRNTFLVRWPYQIGKTVKTEEWNNLYDCGCNFTCLAMIAGLDPARLASELSAVPGFFTADIGYTARCFDGAEHGLVWDQNRPDVNRPLVISDVWHTGRNRRTTITIEALGEEAYVETLEEADAIIAAARADGLHVICGPKSHSHLVAGINEARDYFVWDPDAETRPVEESLAGKVTLRRLFNEHKQAIGLARYRVTFADAVPAQP